MIVCKRCHLIDTLNAILDMYGSDEKIHLIMHDMDTRHSLDGQVGGSSSIGRINRSDMLFCHL